MITDRNSPAGIFWRGAKSGALQSGIFSQVGPLQNAHVESFNGRLRDECLNAHWFVNLADAKLKVESWRQEYNEERPHSALSYRTPDEMAKSGRGPAIPCV